MKQRTLLQQHWIARPHPAHGQILLPTCVALLFVLFVDRRPFYLCCDDDQDTKQDPGHWKRVNRAETHASRRAVWLPARSNRDGMGEDSRARYTIVRIGVDNLSSFRSCHRPAGE